MQRDRQEVALHLHQQSTWRLAAESENPVARGDFFGIIYLASRRRKQPLFIRSDPHMLNLEILRISLILQAPGRSGPPLRSCPTSPRVPRSPAQPPIATGEGLGRGGSGQPGPRQQGTEHFSPAKEALRGRPAVLFLSVCVHMYIIRLPPGRPSLIFGRTSGLQSMGVDRGRVGGLCKGSLNR